MSQRKVLDKTKYKLIGKFTFTIMITAYAFINSSFAKKNIINFAYFQNQKLYYSISLFILWPKLERDMDAETNEAKGGMPRETNRTRFEAARTSSLCHFHTNVCTACAYRHKCSHLRETKIDRYMKEERRRSKEGEGED